MFKNKIILMVSIVIFAGIFSAQAQAVNSGANGLLTYISTNTTISPSSIDSGLYAFKPFGPGASMTAQPISVTSGSDSLVYYPGGATPDGSQIAYARKNSVSSNTTNIFRKNITGVGPETLMTVFPGSGKPYPEGAIYPTYNNTGNKLTFASNHADNARWQVYTMNSDSTNLQQLTSSTSGALDPDWSPDGSKIIYSETETYGPLLGELWIMNSDGSGKYKFLNHGGTVWDFAASWSPNGNQIIFSSTRSGVLNIWKANSDGTGLTQLTNYTGGGNGNASRATWSPAGNKIAYIRNVGGTSYLYTMNADGTNQTVTQPATASKLDSPSWAPTTAAVTLVSTPALKSNVTNPSFQFTADDPLATFECRLDSGAWNTCVSGVNFPGLSNGPHTLDVRALNNPGTGTPTSYAWEVDTTPPVLTITDGPAQGATITDDNPTIEFESNKPGTYQCRIGENWYSEGPGSVVWSPFVPCNGETYSPGPLEDGKYTVEIVATDEFGNTDTKRREFEIDSTAPNVTINTHPAEITNSPNAIFTFSSNDSPVTYQCSLDSAAWASCSTPINYSGLSDGPHNFRVRATDESGNVSSPAVWSWTVDTTAPVVQITSGPSGSTTNPSAIFSFQANETPVDYECSIDGTAWSECDSPEGYTGLGKGSHEFQVRAIDEAGNVSAPASRIWNIVDPDVTIISGPKNGPNTNGKFVFESSVPGAGYQCRLDNGNWQACTSPKEYKNLKHGPHKLEVRARDQYGNFSPVAVWNWTVTDNGQCKISTVRSRFFVFTKKNAVRLIARYKASNQGAVRVKFYIRKANGTKGKFVGVTQARFRKSPKKYTFFRVRKEKTPKQMKELRNVRYGFIANMTVLNSPGYCRRIFNTNLSLNIKRKVQKQNVWFQTGSFGVK